MKVIIIDTHTNQAVIREDDQAEYDSIETIQYMYSEGAWACDCNRKNFFDPALSDTAEICQAERYVIPFIIMNNGSLH